MKKGLAMRRLRKLRSKKAGMAPGTLMYVGEVKVDAPVVSLIEYSTDGIEERTLALDAIKDYKPPLGRKLWLNVHGLHDPQLIADIGRVFQLHALVLEDILNTDQRPKVDNYDDYLYIVARSFYYDQSSKALSSEQVSLVLGNNFVLSFQERPTGAFFNMELRAMTVIAMLFMPATLIAGIFGMNFDYMPWLANDHGFWWVIGLMAMVASSMGLMFWRRQWLGRL